MNDAFGLQRFVDAQSPVYDTVVRELHAGYKLSHWMWFIFPQMQGLGTSEMARRYAIRSLDEARAYLDHPILGGRLQECAAVVLGVQHRTLHQIFGSPDDLKFQSSMTLFHYAEPSEAVFSQALEKYCESKMDPRTLALLDAHR